MSRIFDELLRVREFGQDFLRPAYEDCIDPFLLPDMSRAVERIREAVRRGEKVLIYGDYDVDGVTASTVMYDTLRLAGVSSVEIMLPNRFLDGYGMSKKVVQRARETGVKLVITVDCGSRNGEIIEELGAIGVETVVTDHHECGEALPPAVAVVNPKRRECETRELRELAGVGVAFKVAQALVKAGMIAEGQEKWLLDLVLIGTVCDSMRLTGENRRLGYYGMKVLAKTRRPGLKELMRVAGMKTTTGEAIGFQLGPRLNAAGRMETAERALELLTTSSRTEAARLALELNRLNEQRRGQQNEAVEEIAAQGVGEEPVIVVRGKWHEGVLGIIAGKLVEEYRRPAFVLAECDGGLKGAGVSFAECGEAGPAEGRRVLKGSGRSFGEFNLAEALTVCDKYVLGGGGHKEACGVKVALEGLEEFRRAVNEYYRSLGLENQERYLEVREDIEVEELSELTLELLEELRKLEPFGAGNAEPVFLLRNMRVVEASRMGAEGEHLRLMIWDKQGRGMKLVQFRAPEEYLRLRGGETVDVWMQLVENEFRGIRSAEGRILRIG